MLQTEVCYELTNKILSNSEIFKASAHNRTRQMHSPVIIIIIVIVFIICFCYLYHSCRQKTPSFSQVLDTREKLLLGSRLQPMSMCAGHDLCREGDKNADCFWILEEGVAPAPGPACVECSLSSQTFNERISKNGTIGEAMKSAVLTLTVHAQTPPLPFRGSNACLRVHNAGPIIGSAVLGVGFQMHYMWGLPLQCAEPPDCN